MEFAGTTELVNATQNISTATTPREVLRAVKNAVYVLRKSLEKTNNYFRKDQHDELLREILTKARLGSWPRRDLNSTACLLHADLEYIGGRVLVTHTSHN